MKVLIVEDNRDSREVLKTTLALNGVDAKAFETGAEALHFLEEADGNVEVVILDLSLPTLDGLTIAEQIRKNERLHSRKKPVKLVFFTARNIDEPIQRIAERCNVAAIYQKGASIEQLSETVKGWINNGHSNQ